MDSLRGWERTYEVILSTFSMKQDPFSFHAEGVFSFQRVKEAKMTMCLKHKSTGRPGYHGQYNFIPDNSKLSCANIFWRFERSFLPKEGEPMR